MRCVGDDCVTRRGLWASHSLDAMPASDRRGHCSLMLDASPRLHGVASWREAGKVRGVEAQSRSGQKTSSATMQRR